MPHKASLISIKTIQEVAKKHGFNDVKVTDASPHEQAKNAFKHFIESNRHGSMKWLEKNPEKRSTPSLHLEEARSIITLAINYYREVDENPLKGRVARYAAGKDYHKVIEKKLKNLVQELSVIFPETNHKFYIDYGPIIERAFAERSGLGFIGRSCNLIHMKYGTYVFIATIITSANIETTNAIEGTCGMCRKCIDVCPTGALLSPYQIDATKCISYLTIENRGPIPRHLRPLIGNWIFGCDLCQEVCPYNKRSTQGEDVQIAQTEIAGTSLDIKEILALKTPEQFQKRFQGSPLKRAKREGLLRNAAVVAGNIKKQEFIKPLKGALEDESPLVRGHAVWALGQLGIKPEIPDETDSFVLQELQDLEESHKDSSLPKR